jgi:hypothetical protein
MRYSFNRPGVSFEGGWAATTVTAAMHKTTATNEMTESALDVDFIIPPLPYHEFTLALMTGLLMATETF